MIAKLLLLFTIVPLVETYVLIKVGQVIGPGYTVLLLLLDGLIGAWLAKREGFGIVPQIIAEIREGKPPGNKIVEALLILVGAVLLITPGFTTDIVGYVLLFPPTRRMLAPPTLRWLLKQFNIEGVNFGGARPGPTPAAHPPPFDHPVR